MSSGTTDPNTSNNSATTPTTVQAQSADLAVTKIDTPDPVVPGGNITYTITVSNGGPSDASSVSVQDAMPFNTTFVSLAPPAGWSCTTPGVGSTGLAQCSSALLANGGTAVFTLVVHVSPAAANGSTITNNAFASSQGADDPNMANNTGSAQTAVQSADVAVTKTDSLDPVPAGANLTYTLTVTNNGPAIAQNVTLSDPLPAGTTFVSLSPASGWTCTTPSVGATGTVSCAVPSLGNGASAVFTIVVTVGAGLPDGTVISNTASAQSTTGDANPANNSATQTTTVGATADVSVTKSAPATVPSESDLSYTITATNAGPSPSQGVTLTDTVPAGTTFVSLTVPSGWVCNTPAPGGTGPVTCTASTFPSATSAVFTLVVHVADPNGFITNTATVSSTTNDQNSANNTATAGTAIVNPSADVTVTKTDSPYPVVAGANLTYTITAINNGPSTAHGVVVSDSLSVGGLSVVSATPSQGSCTETSAITCSLGSLANGASVPMTLVIHVGSHFTAGTV
ncbi:MAG TPA: DUF11 domain-containing protein, partial [Acidimicrobiia bacterium]|nr:DUF11 domain-containing protein [Acidimicrobiia bacterium]